MTLEALREALLYATLIHYGLVLLWFAAFRLAHDALYRLHSRWFALPVETFDAIHYAGLAAYKIGILLLALVPYLALCLLG